MYYKLDMYKLDMYSHQAWEMVIAKQVANHLISGYSMSVKNTACKKCKPYKTSILITFSRNTHR